LLITGAGGADYALGVTTTGNITVNNTDVVGNSTTFGGAALDNSIGTGNVAVSNGSFSNNSGANADGLRIFSKGTVTLKDVDASANNKRGAYIENSGASTPKAVTLNGSNTFSNNNQNGLTIYSRGTITLNNTTAVGNGQTGVYLDNCVFDFVSNLCGYSTGGAGVTLNGVNAFVGNGDEGLRVWSGGAISLSNVTANGNGFSASRSPSTLVDPDGIPASGDEYYTYDAEGKGVFLNNYGAASPKPVTISGTNFFNLNGSSGLFVYTKGLFTGNNLTANSNGCNPVYDLDTSYCAGIYIYSESGARQTGYGVFQNNTRDGLFVVVTKGLVALNNLDAQGNGLPSSGSGVNIEGTYSPTISIPVVVTGINVFNGNRDYGLDVNTTGAVSLYNATANSNINGDGLHIYNRFSFKGAVNLLGQTSASGNNGSGIEIYSYGAVTTSGIYARDNGSYGAYIDNCDLLASCNAPAALPVTMNGDNAFYFNTGSNLHVVSRGAITVNNLSAYYSSTGSGATLDNRHSNATAGVTLKGYARAENNDSNNISIYSNGTVAAANVRANNSLNGMGMDIDNSTAAMPGVVLSGSNQFNDNKFTGLYVITYGAISASNLNASGNGNPAFAYGAYLRNAGGSIPKPITLTGINVFNANFSTGLVADSYGAITVNNITARFNVNGGNGAALYNQYGLYIQPITVAGYGVFDNNNGAGLSIESNGNVTMANLAASFNGSDGAYVNTSNGGAASAAANVILTGANNLFYANSVYGLYVANDGNITVSNVSANSNALEGARLNNAALAGIGEVKTITVSGMNNFYSNGGIAGLFVNSSGGANLTRIKAGLNYDPGGPTTAGLFANVAGTLTLTCGQFTSNEGAGYNLSAATIYLKGFLSSNNGAADSAAAGMVVREKTCLLP
jgi:hypothetical protein